MILLAQPARDKVEVFVIIVVSLVWAITYGAAVFIRDFQPRPEVAFIMSGVIGAIWGARVFRRSRNGNGRP